MSDKKIITSDIVSNDPIDYVKVALAIEILAYHNKGYLNRQDNKSISEQIQALLIDAIKKSEEQNNEKI